MTERPFGKNFGRELMTAQVILILLLSLTIGSGQSRDTRAASPNGRSPGAVRTGQADANQKPVPNIGASPGHSAAAANEPKIIEVEGTFVSIPDAGMLDQDGNSVRFYTDLIKGKVAVIGFFYSSCMNICVRHGKVFSALQKRLGDSSGKDVFLISVTLDPETDTPGRLAEWGRQYGRKRGWTLLTGTKEQVGAVVGQMPGDAIGRAQMHTAFIFMGNDKTDKWLTAYGLEDPDELIKKVRSLIRPGEK